MEKGFFAPTAAGDDGVARRRLLGAPARERRVGLEHLCGYGPPSFLAGAVTEATGRAGHREARSPNSRLLIRGPKSPGNDILKPRRRGGLSAMSASEM